MIRKKLFAIVDGSINKKENNKNNETSEQNEENNKTLEPKEILKIKKIELSKEDFELANSYFEKFPDLFFAKEEDNYKK